LWGKRAFSLSIEWHLINVLPFQLFLSAVQRRDRSLYGCLQLLSGYAIKAVHQDLKAIWLYFEAEMNKPLFEGMQLGI